MLDKVEYVLGKLISIIWSLVWLLFICSLLNAFTGVFTMIFGVIADFYHTLKLRWNKSEVR